MSDQRLPEKIMFLGDYPPRRCGIATFTYDLREAAAQALPGAQCQVVAVTEPSGAREYPPEVRFEIPEGEIEYYQRAADFLNLARCDVLCVQHEFGIYGGPAGSHLGALLRKARMPTVTTLHTILREPSPEQLRAFRQVLELSTKVVVMTSHGAGMLREIYGAPEKKIAVIPHGIPDVPFEDPNFYKDQFGVEGRPVLLTFGLLSPGKGIEYALRALPAIAARHPSVVYIILGATHPNLLREQGETYRLSLERLARELGVEDHVMFVNRYVSSQELREYIGAADIYLTPYLNEAQITSGTLVYCFGAGKAVVSTPYWHARELLAEDRGALVPFRDAGAIAEAVSSLLSDEPRRHAMRKNAYRLGREMVWAEVGRSYARLFEEAVAEFRLGAPRRGQQPATLSAEGSNLPVWRLDHLARLTDSTGTFQHAVYSLPWFEHGYCTDDNARALLFTVLFEALDGQHPELPRLQTASAAFLQHAFDPAARRFRNFLSFDRRWLEECGSEDSHGRAVWALGAVVGRTRHAQLRAWATSLFEMALPPVENFTSPRAWAFALLGIQEYLRVLHGDLLANRLRAELAERIEKLFEATASEDWKWCEPVVSYDNARLPQALISAGRWTANERQLRWGLESLRWLMDHQRSAEGYFRPVGSNGFWRRGRMPAWHDQQPLEACACVSACMEAHGATGDPHWQHEARRAFDWYLGANDLGAPLYDAATGGCCDGLHESRVNQNQGAESTLSFLIALAEMRALLEQTASFDPAQSAA
ncbi:MAG: glycosyltransferase family 4 protein [Terrimicrobiaceae bacterium]|nr:glycosyltransferase family 4 protein [Terrimicrobiaceae bacterium]